MRLFNFLVLVALVFSYVIAGNYEMTYYGCPDECGKQENPSCGLPIYPLEHGATKFFAALSARLSNFKDYCGQRAVVMLADGSKKMLNLEVVDFCRECDPYFIDLSSYSFGELLDLKKGVGKVIWAVYNKSGKRLIGPYTSDINKLAKKFDMSESSFKSAFDANAKDLISSHDNIGEFNSKSKSGGSSSSSSSSSSGSRSISTSTDGKCGPNNGKNCHTGECCSKYGYCGKDEDYCGKNCLNEYGHCW